MFDYAAGPTANFTAAWADAQSTQLRLTDTSTDPDGQIIAWKWDFGDGTTSTARNPPLKSWARAGVYTITLVVTDNLGHQGNTSTQVTIQGGSNRGTLAH